MEGLGARLTERSAQQQSTIGDRFETKPAVGGKRGHIGLADLDVQGRTSAKPAVLDERLEQLGSDSPAPECWLDIEIIDVAPQSRVLHGVAHREYCVADCIGAGPCQPYATEGRHGEKLLERVGGPLPIERKRRLGVERLHEFDEFADIMRVCLVY